MLAKTPKIKALPPRLRLGGSQGNGSFLHCCRSFLDPLDQQLKGRILMPVTGGFLDSLWLLGQSTLSHSLILLGYMYVSSCT